ncbi:MAG: alpha/beta fold hydrolase, partial [Planctomycetota bacterium]
MRRIRHGIAQTDDGTDLWWELDAGDGSGPPLCFLNGANCSTFYWPPLLRRLAGRSPVLLWDYRGHGRSGRGVAPRSITIERFAADLQTVLDAAGVDQVVLIGHSLGVMVGLEGYRQFPDRVAGLTLAFGSHGDSLANLKDPERVANVVDRAMHALGRAVQPPGVRGLVEKFLRSRPGIYAASLLGANAALLPSGYLERLMDHVTTMDPDV